MQIYHMSGDTNLGQFVRIVDGDSALNVNPDGSLNSAVVGTITLAPNQSIKLTDGTHIMVINPDGSLNTNILNNLTLVPNQSIKLTDGTDIMLINSDGSLNVTLLPNQSIKLTDGTDILNINTDGSIPVTIQPNQKVEIYNGTNTQNVNADGSINVNLSDPTTPTNKQKVDGVGRAEIKLTDSTGLIDVGVTSTNELKVETIQKPNTLSNTQLVDSSNRPIKIWNDGENKITTIDPLILDVLGTILSELQRIRVGIDEMSDLDTRNLGIND